MVRVTTEWFHRSFFLNWLTWGTAKFSTKAKAPHAMHYTRRRSGWHGRVGVNVVGWNEDGRLTWALMGCREVLVGSVTGGSMRAADGTTDRRHMLLFPMLRAPLVRPGSAGLCSFR